MTPLATSRTTLTRIVTTMLMASALSATAAHAATFQYRHPVVGLVASPTSQAEQVVTEIVMALTGGPALPAGEVNWPYSYDLKQLLSVTGDPAYNSSSVSWELTSGALPAGLSLGSDGVVSGTPTTKDAVGSSFQVKAAYKTKTGQQAYTIVVNGAVLHVTQISAGYRHTCAVTTSGGLTCWGDNANGQLGDGTIINKKSPTTVPTLSSGVTRVSAGGSHTCALTTGGGLKCWGANNYGQLGDGTTTPRKVPTDVQGLTSNVASIAAGNVHTCAVTISGAAKCWGSGTLGSLGDGTATDKTAPVVVSGLSTGVASLTAGHGHTCVVTTSGAAKCWGYNYSGQVGNGGLYTTQNTPATVNGLSSNVALITAGYQHTCALTTLGEALCWGANGYGQIGDGSTTNRSAPTVVSSLNAGTAALSAGFSHTCALTAVGAAKCWGYNNSGQLGDGTTMNRTTPVPVLGLDSGGTDISARESHTCAITSSGVRCWGANGSGQLGNNSATNSSAPVAAAP